MKSIIAASLTAVAALSLGACSRTEPASANLADNELTLNEADIPAEGNSTLGFDNTLGNADAGLGNDVLLNEAVITNAR